MTDAKVIKRYANRKLYDTERSCYVTLDEIASMIKDGEDVRVVDNKTKEDLTAVTLAQIIVEEEKRETKMPLKLLRSIIQSGGEQLSDFYQNKVADPVTNMRETVEKRVSRAFKKESDGEDAPKAAAKEDGASAEPSPAETSEATTTTEEVQATGEAEAGPVKAFVNSATEAFESFQRSIDDSVKEGLGRMTHLPHVGADVERLQNRIAELEKRLAELEAKKQTPSEP